MHTATAILIILAAGLASQWIAWILRLPAIVVLIAAGLVLGPITGILAPAEDPDQLTELIGLGVAIILFEGGMDLKLGELRRVGHGIGRLTLLAAPLAWVLGSAAAHYLAGLSWPVAVVLGATLVVTGPTVIGPLLRQAGLNKESSSLLKWEGIINDPAGVLLAVLAFQYFTIQGESLVDTFTGLGAAVAAAIVLGGIGGWLTGHLYRRGGVPEHLKPPVLMVLVLVVYWASNLVQHEAGLLSVTLMGLVIGNMRLGERDELQDFKENLTIVLLSVLFIVIPTQLEAAHLDLLDARLLLFVAAILFVVRPLSIWLATIRAPIRREDRLLLAWIAPRGIVAAATAGLFGPALMAAGFPDAELLLPLVFLIILVTVLLHGLSLGPIARYFELAAEDEKGLLIVGASPWSCELAGALKDLEINVLMVDGSYRRLQQARMRGIDVWYGEILSEQAEHELELQAVDKMLCATENDFYNALVCRAMGQKFGRHLVYQLAMHEQIDQDDQSVKLQQRGNIAFDDQATYESLHQRLEQDWQIQTTRLTEKYTFEDLETRLGQAGSDWLPLGAVTPAGDLKLYSEELEFEAEPDWTLLYFGPERPVGPAPA
ncbi:MAG: sodium:proton antiporter [Wenzhouxiangellaceae bacterium]|nr:sodium:proton antiporter [Wenzhouxiangellaceae bacterium]